MMESFDFGAPSARDGGFPPGRAAGLARLEAFAPRAGRAYRDARNTDPGPGRPTGVSRLSPYVRGRLVLEEEALAAALARHAPSACEKFVQEVFWRGYFKGWLEHRPEVWDDYVEERDAARAAAAEDARLGARLAAAQEGRTGVACFDAWIAELIETGWLHNHARMWTASIWIFTLELPWALGADLFMRHLVDADPASNTLSWRWVGGLHTRGKTYLARASNIAKHTNGRFRPGPGELAPDAPPLEGPPNPSAEPIPPADPAPAGRVFLLATEDEGRIEHLVAESGAAAEAVGVGALISAGRRSPEPLGAPARAFAEAAAADAAARAAAAAGLPPASALVARAEAVGDAAGCDAVIAAARAAGAEAIATARAPAGPGAEAEALLLRRAQAAGLPVRRLRRRYDALVWPHATKGFFALKEKIPRLLREIGLSA